MMHGAIAKPEEGEAQGTGNLLLLEAGSMLLLSTSENHIGKPRRCDNSGENRGLYHGACLTQTIFPTDTPDVVSSQL